MQGARIGKGVYIDSLDINDCDLVVIGDSVAINEGVTILGHYFKDGFLHFGQVQTSSLALNLSHHWVSEKKKTSGVSDLHLQVVIGSMVSLQPYSAVQPGSKLGDKMELAALRKTKSSIVHEKKDPFAFMKKAAAAASGSSKPDALLT